jgi:gliding motility-associated-like protein
MLDIPNVFTPNGDNINDYFKISYNFAPENYKITILNRWGNKLFETDNINNSWNGKYNGNQCSSGVYYYLIQFKNRDKIETKNGFLHLYN